MYNQEKGITWFSTTRKEQARRIAARLIGRKCDVVVKESASRVLVMVYQ